LTRDQKTYANKSLFDNLSFKIPKRATVGIIGGNGAGKSALFKMIAGDEMPTSSEIEIGETVNIAFIKQSREQLQDSKTVWEAVSEGMDNLVIGNYEVNSRAYVGRFNFKGTNQQKHVGNLSGGEHLTS